MLLPCGTLHIHEAIPPYYELFLSAPLELSPSVNQQVKLIRGLYELKLDLYLFAFWALRFGMLVRFMDKLDMFLQTCLLLEFLMEMK